MHDIRLAAAIGRTKGFCMGLMRLRNARFGGRQNARTFHVTPQPENCDILKPHSPNSQVSAQQA